MNTNSIEAHETVKPYINERCAAVLATLTAVKEGGLTDDEGEAVMGWNHQSYSPRRYDLAKAGLIRKTGERRRTRSGCMADVWVVVGE